MISNSMPGPVNILMVDDQPAKLLSYEVMLEELGENLLKATSGRVSRIAPATLTARLSQSRTMDAMAMAP